MYSWRTSLIYQRLGTLLGWTDTYLLRTNWNLTIGGSRGACRAHAPPTGPNSFVFAYIFAEKHPRQRSTPPLTGPCPPLREILDLPLLTAGVRKEKVLLYSKTWVSCSSGLISVYTCYQGVGSACDLFFGSGVIQCHHFVTFLLSSIEVTNHRPCF